MVYSPTGKPFTVDVGSLKGNKVKAFWLNPINGEEVAMDSEVGSGEVAFEPPTADDHDDWVLVLELRGKNCRC